MHGGDRGLIWAGWSVLIASAGVIVAVPLLMLTRTSWLEGRGRLAEVLTQPGFGTAVAHSFELSVATTALAVPIGVAIALALRDPRLPGRAFWRAAVLLPLLVPDFVLGYSWLRAYARAGLTSELFGFVWSGVQSPVGVAVIVAVSAVPLVYLIITVGLATRAEPITERAAHASGATPFTVLRTITLPLLAPAIATSAVVVFVLTSGHVCSASSHWYASRFQHDYDPDLRRSQLRQRPAELCRRDHAGRVAGDHHAGRGGSGRRFARRTAPTAPHLDCRPRLAEWRPAREHAEAADLGDLPDRYRGPALAGAHQCGDHPGSRRAVDPGQLDLGQLPRRAYPAYRSSAGPQPAAFPVGRVDTPPPRVDRCRLRSDPARSRDHRVDHPHPCAPWLNGRRSVCCSATADGSPIPWRSSSSRTWPSSGRWRIARSRLRSIALPPAGLRAARASGATLATGLGTVALPLIRAALITAWALCFLTALHEVTMSSLLYGPGSETLAVVVLNSADLGQIGVTAALSVLVTLVVVLPAAALWALSRRTRA